MMMNGLERNDPLSIDRLDNQSWVPISMNYQYQKVISMAAYAFQNTGCRNINNYTCFLKSVHTQISENQVLVLYTTNFFCFLSFFSKVAPQLFFVLSHILEMLKFQKERTKIKD